MRKSSCQIKIYDQEKEKRCTSACFVSIQTDSKSIKGLLTNNEVIDEDFFQKSEKIEIFLTNENGDEIPFLFYLKNAQKWRNEELGFVFIEFLEDIPEHKDEKNNLFQTLQFLQNSHHIQVNQTIGKNSFFFFEN